MTRLDNKVAIVTGARSGIGRATALLFAREGAKVVVPDCSGAEDDTAREIGENALAVHADVALASEVRAMVETARSHFGQLDVLFNNAGVKGQQAPTAEATEENFDHVISINLKGVFLGMKYGIPLMLENGGGTVISTASVAGLVGFAGISAYSASKGGVTQLTKAAALDYAKENVRVNAICPGVIKTPLIDRFMGDDPEAAAQMEALEPVGRMGTPDEVAQMALFLASDESSFITAAALPVDGGFVAQ